MLGRENRDEEGVRVGDVVVRLDGRESNGVAKVGKQGVSLAGRLEKTVVEAVIVIGKIQQEIDNGVGKCKLIRKFRSVEADLSWAHRGIMVTVRDRESITIMQNRIMDVGFNDLNIFTIGGDKVFISTTQQLEVMYVINGAKEFFNMLFVNFKPWNKDTLSIQRGACVCIYGIPLHAWNESFFKLCIMDCGRYLRTEYIAIDKEHLEYARVLIAMSSLNIINAVDTILVDGMLLEVKIIEEWEVNLGEDACLFEEENVSVSSHSDHEEGVIGDDVRNIVDLIVDKLAEDGVDAYGCNVSEDAGCMEDNPIIASSVVLKESTLVKALSDKGNDIEKEVQQPQAVESVSSTYNIICTISCL